MRSATVHTLVLVAGGGFLAGALDLAFACLFWAIKSDVPVSRILQSIAAGVFGAASFEGGAVTATVGLVLHFLIVLAMALAYYLAARQWPPLCERPWMFGGAYGLLLYGVMHYVVVPLSRASAAPGDPLWITLVVAAHVLLVGVPIALFASRAVMHRPPAGG
jgi:uncharacterized membrane protein YagU involved in acid resistance